jgi:hypothetical protein
VGLYILKQEDTVGAKVIGLEHLDSRGQAWYASLSRHLQYSQISFRTHAQLDIGSAYVYIHFLYHASLATLSYSLAVFAASIPELSSPLTLSLFTDSALKHANMISTIIGDLLGPFWDVTRTPPFVGYAAYIATSIQLSYISSRTTELATSSRQNIETNIRLLIELGPFWALPDKLVYCLQYKLMKVTKVRILCEVHGSQYSDGISTEIMKFAPYILRYGLTLFDTEPEKQQPTPSQITAPPLLTPDTLPTTQPSPFVDDPLGLLSFADMPPVSPEECLAYFPLLADVAFPQSDENHVVATGDFMEQIWAMSLNPFRDHGGQG